MVDAIAEAPIRETILRGGAGNDPRAVGGVGVASEGPREPRELLTWIPRPLPRAVKAEAKRVDRIAVDVQKITPLQLPTSRRCP